MESARVPEMQDLGVEGARAQHAQMRLVFGDRPLPVARVEERSVAGGVGPLRCRFYVPAKAPGGPPPLLVFFHGGGFVLGGLDSSDTLCRLLCRQVPCMVASVDYRLAPENPFPAAVDDALASYLDLARQAERLGADPTRVAVGGDSAGGNLSAVICLLSRDRGLRLPAVQLLIYPMTDDAAPTRSREIFGRGFMLTTEMISWFSANYLAGHDKADPMVSPLRWEGHADLPRTVLVTAGFDPLRDEGEAFASKLEAAGVPVEVVRARTLPHGFVQMICAIDAAREAADETCAALGRAFEAAKTPG
jgi:acetyl esterase